MRQASIFGLAFVLFLQVCTQTYAQSLALKQSDLTTNQICKLIAREANTNGLPPSFFARLIWKESRFDAGAISPAGAQGIAQFMPATAKSEGLRDPFDPKQAIPASALLLSKLRLKFGNLGLAAAAYNAGEGRVDSWLRKGGVLPIETENYVLDITGEPADSFFEPGKQIAKRPLEENLGFMESCIRLPIIRSNATPMAVALTMPWAIQVAGNFRRSVVERQWRRIKSRNTDLLTGQPMAISRVRSYIGRRGIYAARIGAASRSRANAICGALRANGTACVVMKN
ncbi:MAG: lytic transglycosylase domain-containing protein [Pseudomonadota bacterium]